MLRLMMTGAALAVAAPALAQQTVPADPATSAQPTTSSPANQASQVAAIIDNEYPVYDADKSGALDKAEFSKWLLALKQQELQATGKTLPPAELTAWVSAAFQTADADKNGQVSKPELTAYLGG